MRHMLQDVFFRVEVSWDKEFKNASDAFKYDTFACRSSVSGTICDTETTILQYTLEDQRRIFVRRKIHSYVTIIFFFNIKC